MYFKKNYRFSICEYFLYSLLRPTCTPNVIDLYEKWERLNYLFVTLIKTNFFC